MFANIFLLVQFYSVACQLNLIKNQNFKQNKINENSYGTTLHKERPRIEDSLARFGKIPLKKLKIVL